MLYISILLLAFILSIFFNSLTLDLSFKKKIVNKEGIPFLASLPIYLAFLNSIFIYNFFSGKPFSIPAIYISAALILILGLIDDFKELGPIFKIAGQITAVIPLLLSNIKMQIIYVSPFFNSILTLFWLLLIINAFNLLDIMDGLAAGLAVIISLTFFIISISANNFTMAVITAALAGSILGFLRYNLPPAKIYMGNAGSMLIGLLLGAIALSISYASAGREVALFTPLIVLGLPLYDTVFVSIMRLIKGKSPIRKSNDHFALRLLASGYSQKKALAIMYLFALIFSVFALLVSKASNFFGLTVIVILILICLALGKKIAVVKVSDD